LSAKTTCAFVHLAPHAPQLSMLRMLVSQPVLSWGGRQCAYPSAHCHPHLPPVHVGELFAVLQMVPHAPQFRTSLASKMHSPLQHVAPAPHAPPSPHVATQLPLGLHNCPPPHCVSAMHATQRWLVVWQC
jgi:hypothetical protein